MLPRCRAEVIASEVRVVPSGGGVVEQDVADDAVKSHSPNCTSDRRARCSW